MAAHPAAAAAGVLPMVLGPSSPGVVLGSLRKAVIVGVTTSEGPRVVSLLHREAAGIPNGVRIPGDPPFEGIRAGEPALVGAGTVEVGMLSVRVVRTWDSLVPEVRPDPAAVDQLRSAAEQADRGVDQLTMHRLGTALDTGHALPAAIDALIGLGRGLTPGGDDIVAGLLTALHATGRSRLAQLIGDRALRKETTQFSADLLRLARDGHACSEALAVLRALHRTAAAAAAAIDRLLSVGHTSGADLATGMAIGLTCERVDDATYFNAARRLPRLRDAAPNVAGSEPRSRDHQRAGRDGNPVEHRTRRGTGLLDS